MVRVFCTKAMRKILLMLIFVGVIVMSAGANFSWRNDYIWQKTEAGFRSRQMGFGNVSTGNLSFADYTLEMDIEFKEFTQWGNMRVMVRQNGLFDSYSLNIDQNGLSLWRYDGRWDIGQSLATYHQRIGINEKNHLRLVVKGNSFQVDWNGKKVMSATDKLDKYPYGGALLRTEMAITEVSNINLQLERTVDEAKALNEMWQRVQKSHPLPPNPKPFKTAEEVGFNDMMLIYTGYYDNGAGDWNYLDALPLVAYLNQDFSIADSLFDAFLLLGIGSPNNRYFDAIRGGNPQTAGNLEDWLWYLDHIFAEKTQLAAFDKAKAKVNETLEKMVKAKVVIMIPNPLPAQQNFGEVEGEKLSFSSEGQGVEEAYKKRFKAVDWYVSEVEKRWHEADYKNLELLGFYWMTEDIGKPEETRLVRKVADYLHERDYKFYWIPYNKAPGYQGDYGFDCVFLQPNYMFNEQVAVTRFWHTYVDALTYGTNFEIEGEDSVMKDPMARQRYLNYLRAGVTLGYMNSAKAYYFGSKTLVKCALEDDPQIRGLYDQTYLFTRGKFAEKLW